MFEHHHKVRVRYGETDQMGYCYYGNYAQFYEVGRVEALRSLGFNYKKLEEEGIMLPVLDFTIKYVKPAFYDDELTIKTMIKESPGARIIFDYEMYNAMDQKINMGRVVLVFIDKNTGKPTRAPEKLQQAIDKSPGMRHLLLILTLMVKKLYSTINFPAPLLPDWS